MAFDFNNPPLVFKILKNGYLLGNKLGPLCINVWWMTLERKPCIIGRCLSENVVEFLGTNVSFDRPSLLYTQSSWEGLNYMKLSTL